MKGYIIVEKDFVSNEEVYKTVKELINKFFHIKDDLWDADDRDKAKWYIVNLRNGKAKLLKGWKTPYVIDCEEETDTYWYNDKQIKALEVSLK